MYRGEEKSLENIKINQEAIATVQVRCRHYSGNMKMYLQIIICLEAITVKICCNQGGSQGSGDNGKNE